MNKDKESVCVVSPSANIASTVKIRGIGKVILGEYVTIEDYVLLDTGNSKNSLISIGARTKIKQGAVIRTYDGTVTIGTRTTVGEYSILSGHGGLLIGDAVIIAGQGYFSAAEHIFESDISTRFQGETASGITVGNGAWFGARCVVLDGVVVGKNCVVGAASVVTRKLRDNTVCFGVPCCEVYMRNFGEQKIG